MKELEICCVVEDEEVWDFVEKEITDLVYSKFPSVEISLAGEKEFGIDIATLICMTFDCEYLDSLKNISL